MKFEHKLSAYNNDMIFADCNDKDLQGPDFPEKGLYKEAIFNVFHKTEWKNGRKINGDPFIIGYFRFSPMPGCCGIVVSHDTHLLEEFRHTFLSNHFRELKEEIAKKLGYSMMIATTQMKNIPAVKNMFKSKYEIPITFTNSRTTNLIGVGLKIVR